MQRRHQNKHLIRQTLPALEQELQELMASLAERSAYAEKDQTRPRT